jgi:serine/threonine protein kinase
MAQDTLSRLRVNSLLNDEPGGERVPLMSSGLRHCWFQPAVGKVTTFTAGPAAGPAIMRTHMSLSSGTKLGPYEIQSPLGAGGMGEVYRARDTRLDRTVAIKILPAHLAGHPEARSYGHGFPLRAASWLSD